MSENALRVNDNSVKVRQLSHYQFSWIAGEPGQPGTYTLQLVLDQGAWEEILTLDPDDADNLQDLPAESVRRLVDEMGVTDVVDLRTDVERASTGDGPLAAEGVRFHTLSLYPEDSTEHGIPDPDDDERPVGGSHQEAPEQVAERAVAAEVVDAAEAVVAGDGAPPGLPAQRQRQRRQH